MRQFSIRLEDDVYRELAMLKLPNCKSRAEKIRTLLDWALEDYKAEIVKHEET